MSEKVYYESIWKKDPATGKDGVRGPVPFQHIVDWQAEKPHSREFVLQPEGAFLPLTSTEVWQTEARLRAAVSTIDYAHDQLLFNLLLGWTSWSLRHREGTPRDWTCAETPARVLPARCLPYFQCPPWCEDDMAPDGHRLPSVWDAMERWMKAEGKNYGEAGIQVGYSVDRSTWGGWYIPRVTGGRYGHVIVVVTKCKVYPPGWLLSHSWYSPWHASP